jgi:hypothetical protein
VSACDMYNYSTVSFNNSSVRGLVVKSVVAIRNFDGPRGKLHK